MNKQPNFLLIVTDQHRLEAVGAYRDTPCRTPHIDRLAAEGVRFENAYTACPVCMPARATLMTGLYPHSHGLLTNTSRTAPGVADTPHVLPRRLQQVGYQTGYTGKWHLGDTESPFGPAGCMKPSDYGFVGQDFLGHGGGGHRYDEYRQYLARRGYEHRVVAEPKHPVKGCGELAGPPESTVAWFLADHTMQLVDRFSPGGNPSSPFFIWHNFWGPHEPYFAPKQYVDMYRNVEIPPWPNFHWPARNIPGPHHAKLLPDHEQLTWNDYAETIRYYYAITSLIDDQIGRMRTHLEQTGQWDNTIVIFCADHGETIGSHGGLTDKGWHHFDETHRIPLIVRLPDGNGAGMVREELVSLADLAPTITDLAGGSTRGFQGESMVPLLRGDAGGWRDFVVTEFAGVNHDMGTMRTIRIGDIKYGWNLAHEDELYDLKRDPHETLNLIRHPDYQQALADCRTRLRDWIQKTDDYAGMMMDLVQPW